MTVLIDPHVLVAPTSCGSIDQTAFWTRVVEIAATDRVGVGHETFHWVVTQLRDLGYPDTQVDFGPPDFKWECQAALEKILSRVVRGDHPVEDVVLAPEYLGDEGARLCIVMDGSEHGPALDAMMSAPNHWSPSNGPGAIGLHTFELLFDPDQEPTALKAEAVRAKFAGRRLHVLGGAPTASALADFESELGVPEERVTWIASEKSKPPRNLDKRWGSLDPDVDVVVCVTGRVGHKTWEAGDKAATKCGVKMLECSTQGQLVATFRTWAGRQL